MLNYRPIKIFAIFSLFFLCGNFAHAANLKINSSLLPTIWFSTLDPYEGNMIEIYSALQNQTDVSLHGNAELLIDNVKVAKMSFDAGSNTLTQVHFAWKAVVGNHDIKIQIANLNSSSISGIDADSLQSKENTGSISVSRKIDYAEIKTNIESIATSGIQKIDDTFDALADKIESYKSPISTSSPTSDMGKVLGASTRYSPKAIYEDIKSSNITKGIWNTILDFFALCVRHWKISLITIVLLIVIIKYAMS